MTSKQERINQLTILVFLQTPNHVLLRSEIYTSLKFDLSECECRVVGLNGFGLKGGPILQVWNVQPS